MGYMRDSEGRRLDSIEVRSRPENDATYEAQWAPTPLTWRSQGNPAAVGNSDVLIKGVNLGGIGSPATANWLQNWDWGFYSDGIDKAAAIGANCIRFLGNYSAYSQDPVLFKARYHQMIDYCIERGMKVLPTLLNSAGGSSNDTISTSLISQYEAMITDLCTKYIGSPYILGWDVGNEMRSDDATNITILTALAPYIRALDPTAKVTMSQPVNDPTLVDVMLGPINSLVDFHDLHFYLQPSWFNFPSQLNDYLYFVTRKPILIGEVGSSRGSPPALPNSGGQLGQASYLAAFRRYAASARVMGTMIWKIKDASTNYSKFGLFDEAGNPTQQLAEWYLYPQHPLNAAIDHTEYRTHPVLVDSFMRTASALEVSNPEIGGAPTVIRGVWGIGTLGGAYVATKDGTRSDLLIWDIGTQQPSVIETEVAVPTFSGMNAGVCFDVTDGDNYFAARFRNNVGTLELSVIQVSAGTPSTLASVTVTGPELADLPTYLRISVAMQPYVSGGALQPKYRVLLNGRPLISLARTRALMTTKVGLWIGPTDTTTTFRHVEARVRGRSY